MSGAERRGSRRLAALPLDPPETLGAAGAASQGGHDLLAVEEPLELRVHGRPWLVTLRTPGDDLDLVAGLLRCEGVIGRWSEVEAAEIVAVEGSAGASARCEIELDEAALDRWARRRMEREFAMVGGCGVCGKARLEDLEAQRPRPLASRRSARARRLDPELVRRLPAVMRQRQELFEQTGGLHAAALFGYDGELLLLREDVGRHNAVDKVVGAALRGGFDGATPRIGGRVAGGERSDDHVLHDLLLVVSGRAGFELVHKALCSEVDALIAVGAASTLAVELAERCGLGLYWFVRDEGGKRLPPRSPD